MRWPATGLALAALAAAAEEDAMPTSPEQRADGWFASARAEIERRAAWAARPRNENRAKNVILFVADGNGISTNFATRLWAGEHGRPPFAADRPGRPPQAELFSPLPPNRNYGDEHVLPHETMPHLALSKTYNSNAQTADSAGTASALNTGVKTKSGVISVAEGLRRGHCEDLPGNVAETFAEAVKAHQGKGVGVVTTARLTHATPSAVYSHSADRNFEYHWDPKDREPLEHYIEDEPDVCEGGVDIATQLIDTMLKADRGVDIALGGGRRGFLPRDAVDEEGKRGKRSDGVNLVERFQDGGGDYVWSAEGLAALQEDREAWGTRPVLGLFESSHMKFEYDRKSAGRGGGGGAHEEVPDCVTCSGVPASCAEAEEMIAEGGCAYACTAAGGGDAASQAWLNAFTSSMGCGGPAPAPASPPPAPAEVEGEEPPLWELTRAAIDYLEKSSGDAGYYLMVEGGRVDHSNHDGRMFRAVTDGMAYQEAIQYALDHTAEEDTLIISTADHSHSLEFNGYCGRGSPIEGLCYDVDGNGEAAKSAPVLADDGLPFTAAQYLNGWGTVLWSPLVGDRSPNLLAQGKRLRVSDEMAQSPSYMQEALLPLDDETHSPTDVAIYARGPWSHLVTGTMEQHAIYHVMRYAVEHGASLPCNGGTSGLPPGACDCQGRTHDECGVCGGAGVPAGKCDCVGHVEDECGVCGGFGRDSCGVCGGPGVLAGRCNCAGDVFDRCGVCGGDGLSCPAPATPAATDPALLAEAAPCPSCGCIGTFVLGVLVGLLCALVGSRLRPRDQRGYQPAEAGEDAKLVSRSSNSSGGGTPPRP